MSVYPSMVGGNIGSLLRMIREDQANSPVAQPVSSEMSSLLRDMVTQPLKNVEAVGSSRMVSVPSEQAPNPQIGGIQDTPGMVVPPQTPAPVSPVSAPQSNYSRSPSASQPIPTPVPTPTPRASVGLGTRINSTPQIKGASTQYSPTVTTPQKQRTGGFIASVPMPTAVKRIARTEPFSPGA